MRNRSRFIAYSLYICAALATALWTSPAAAEDRQAYEVSRFDDAPDPKGPPLILINHIAIRDNPDVPTIPERSSESRPLTFWLCQI